MENLLDIIKEINHFIRYFAPGFIFMSCFQFAGYKKREKEVEYLLIKCITFSFILCAVFDLIAEINIQGECATNKLIIKLNELIQCIKAHEEIVLLLLAVITGLIIGKIVTFKWFQNLLVLIFKRDTQDDAFSYLWANLAKGKPVFVKFSLKNDPATVYEGQIERASTMYENPVLIIQYYRILGTNVDFSNIDQARMIVQYNELSLLEILVPN